MINRIRVLKNGLKSTAYGKSLGPWSTRWAQFSTADGMEHTTFNTERGRLKLISKLTDTSSIVVSIRGDGNAHFFVCTSEDYYHDFCYWIILGGWPNHPAKQSSGVRKCASGIGDGSAPSANSTCQVLLAVRPNHKPLSNEEWKTFMLTWEKKNKMITIHDPYELVLSYTDDEPPEMNTESSQEYYLFFDNPKDTVPKIYRFHNYSYTLTRIPNAELRSQLGPNDSDDICIDLLIGLCADCDLQVSIMDGDDRAVVSKIFNGSSIPRRSDHNLPLWQHAKIEVKNISIYSSPFTVRIVTRSGNNRTSGHWAIANVRECLPKDTSKQTSMTAIQDSNPRWYWPNVTCQKLSYNEENRMIMDPARNMKAVLQSSRFENDSLLCEQSYIGPYCSTRCQDDFDSDCRNVIMCDKQECYCPTGFEGNGCADNCNKWNYGYSCSKTCGSCALRYQNLGVCDIYTGKCRKCQSFPNKYLIPPYCKNDEAVHPPSVPLVSNVTSHSAHVSNIIPGCENIDVSFKFHLNKNGSADYESWSAEETSNSNSSTPGARVFNALLKKLSAGTQYRVRMIMSIENGRFILEGTWETFTTKCQNATDYIVTPDERSLTVTKLPNKVSGDSCPDNWYYITIFSMSPRRSEESSSKFPANFTNLRPYEDYEIEVKGLDGQVYLKRQVKTLEAAPTEVISLKADNIGSTTATISWSPPTWPNGIITGYTIKIKPSYHVGCAVREQAKLNFEEKIIEVDNLTLTHAIIDLMPFVGYAFTVSAHNSRRGLERTRGFETDPLDIPTEKWIDLKFNSKKSKLEWRDPDCNMWTGPVNGSQLFFAGVSPDVRDFTDYHFTTWHSFTLNDSKRQEIHGLETYNVKVHLLHAFIAEKYNPNVFVELNFTTLPSAPPKVRNFEIVEVDSEKKLITLRWQKPLAPTNGRIIGYDINVPESRVETKKFTAFPDETCYLWDDFLCKTVDRIYESSGYIQVRARNEGADEPGESSEKSNILKEKDLVPEKPLDVVPSPLTHGIVKLRWRHPRRTGIPLRIFKIKARVLKTDLARDLSREEIAPSKEFLISTYEKIYETQMELLSSTMYELTIQGVGNRSEGETDTVTVTTESAFNFTEPQEPVINDQGSQIDIVIPAIVNDTTDNLIHIILIGPKPCSSSWPITKNAKKDLRLESSTSAWRIAAFPTIDVANKSFTIGNDKVHGSIANCPLPNGTYVVAYVVLNSRRSAGDQSAMVLSWQSHKVQIGPVKRIPHEAWIVPLVLVLTASAGIAWFYSRRNRKVRPKRTEHDIFPPILTPRKSPSYRETSLLVASRESLIGACEVHTPDVVPTGDRSQENCSETVVKLKDFQDYVKDGIDSGKLNAQYESLPRGQTKSWEYGLLPENKSKNRYANLIAYDETRVKLDKLPDTPFSDYINANYIKGYQKNKAYIATQGPREGTVNDFWRMIWQERVQVICMLANVMESGKKKCEQYWPEIGKEMTFGDINVHNLTHTTFADYTFRTFSVTCDQETRRIEHLHYTAWPDHGVPLYIQSVVAYLKKLLATPQGHGPIVVHCSAGIGRTGTIILCDICLRKAAGQGILDVFIETREMRSQRANMVDNKQQYLLAHLALVECLLSLPTAIPCNETLPMRIQEYKKQLSIQQQRLDESIWQDKALQSPNVKPMEISQNNISKNRYPELAAVVGAALHISRYPTTDNDSDYIFGVYVDSAMRKNNYIASQLPLPSTVNDFWRMIAEFNVELVIVLQPPDKQDPTCCEFIPELDEELHPTPFLTFKGRNFVDEDICTNRKILLTDSSTKPAKERLITVLSLKGWEERNEPPPKPITLVNFWQYAEKIPRGDGPTVVLCHDGVTNCGLYLTLSFLLERMGLERECDVCLAIRAVRRSRSDFCRALEQFEYLYDTALIYADYFETYANFT
ncbi:receptor-type tyrosine-protein phosphatase T isoform X2 [Fopius arisanus]|uniref:protein-tyrosine-phosphatase n=1 Tax=Fopius arisanus TaxID=64838 RepID=A0A9R1U3W0_9HYME|nr:PREDICTED: receptor-type tyrosine-protein phosphatase T-like isoform X2 [Fopius arisanus]